MLREPKMCLFVKTNQMKKYIFAVVIIALASCSPSDESSPQTGRLLTKIVESFDGGETQTTVYHYNGNKLLSAVTADDDRKLAYEYSGDLLSDIHYQNANGVDYAHTEFSYNAGKLSHVTFTNNYSDNSDYADYSYNDDGTVTVVSHYWDSFEFEYSVQTSKYFLSDGDIVKIETYFAGGTQTSVYAYDGKPNPYANVTGFSKLLDFYLSAHNMVSGTISSPDGSLVQQTDTSISYDDEDYPAMSVTTGTGSTKTTNYFYD